MLSCLAVVLIGISMMRHLFTTTKSNRDDCCAEYMVIKIGTLIRWRIAVIITSQTSYNDLIMKHGDVYIQKNATIYFAFFLFAFTTLANSLYLQC